MATVNVTLRESRANNDGFAPLYAICRHRGNAARLSLKLRVKPKDWNPRANEARKSCPARNEVNERIEATRLAGRKVITRLSARKINYTAKDVRRELRHQLFGGSGGNFIRHAEGVLASIKKRQSYSTWLQRRAGLSKLRSFASERNGLSFASLDRSLLREYVIWLEEKGLARLTIQGHLGTLRIFVTEALKDKKIDDNPFRHYTFETKAAKSKPRAWLRKKEIRSLASLSPNRSYAQISLDMFLFSYYAWGMRFSDVFGLKKSDVSAAQLNYTMRKTDMRVALPLTDPAREIVRRYRTDEREYLFPLASMYDIQTADEFERAKRSKNKLVNRNLKRLAPQAGIDKHVTFHVARHSAASQTYLATEDIYRVKRFLGHSSVTMTENYLRGMDGISLDELGDWEGLL